MPDAGRVLFRAEPDAPLPPGGTYVTPTIIELDRARELKQEVFGPVLHVVRWRADELDLLLDDIAANGTALTLGIHSRIESTADRIVMRLPARQRLRQPQHDRRGCRHAAVRRTNLSGTGPKAGGPNYLRRFTAEQVVTVNTAAAGGNAGLLALDE